MLYLPAIQCYTHDFNVQLDIEIWKLGMSPGLGDKGINVELVYLNLPMPGNCKQVQYPCSTDERY